MVGRPDFVNMYAFASQLLQERGVAFRIDGREARRGFAEAWKVIGASSPLRAPRFSTGTEGRDCSRHRRSGLRSSRFVAADSVVLTDLPHRAIRRPHFRERIDQYIERGLSVPPPHAEHHVRLAMLVDG
jgi:hypothetical protein